MGEKISNYIRGFFNDGDKKLNGIENIVSSGVTIIVHGDFSIFTSRMDGECWSSEATLHLLAWDLKGRL